MALRKGRKGRTVPPTRVDAILRAARRLGKITTEELKLRKAKARAERLKLKTENDAKANALREYEHARLRAKDEARRRGFENLGAFSPDAARAVEQPAPPAPGHFTSLKDNPFPPKSAPLTDNPEREYIARVDRDGKVTKEYLPPPRAADAPKVAVSEDYKPPVRGKQPTRKELAARHARCLQGNTCGFSDPGGVVSRNINSESGGATVRVTGPWPGRNMR